MTMPDVTNTKPATHKESWVVNEVRIFCNRVIGNSICFCVDERTIAITTANIRIISESSKYFAAIIVIIADLSLYLHRDLSSNFTKTQLT